MRVYKEKKDYVKWQFGQPCAWCGVLTKKVNVVHGVPLHSRRCLENYRKENW